MGTRAVANLSCQAMSSITPFKDVESVLMHNAIYQKRPSIDIGSDHPLTRSPELFDFFEMALHCLLNLLSLVQECSKTVSKNQENGVAQHCLVTCLFRSQERLDLILRQLDILSQRCFPLVCQKCKCIAPPGQLRQGAVDVVWLPLIKLIHDKMNINHHTSLEKYAMHCILFHLIPYHFFCKICFFCWPPLPNPRWPAHGCW